MSELFRVDNRDLKRLLTFYKNSPRQFQRAAAGVLNTFAFGVKTESVKSISHVMKIRDKRFVETSIRVQKSNPSHALQGMRSQAGSIRRDRFSGWEEQETGLITKRKRISTTAARAGNIGNKIQAGSRFKSANKFINDSQFASKNHVTQGQRTVAMLRQMRKGSFKNKAALIRSGLPGNLSKFQHGIYAAKSGKIHLLQALDPKYKQPRIARWMRPARQNYLKSANVKKIWGEQISRVLKY